MANANSAADLRGLSKQELTEQLLGYKEELFGLRFQAATGQLENTSSLREVKKNIARIYTVLRERSLGIIDDPDQQEASA